MACHFSPSLSKCLSRLVSCVPEQSGRTNFVCRTSLCVYCSSASFFSTDTFILSSDTSMYFPARRSSSSLLTTWFQMRIFSIHTLNKLAKEDRKKEKRTFSSVRRYFSSQCPFSRLNAGPQMIESPSMAHPLRP